MKSFNTPWTSNALPSGVGLDKSALFVVTYIDFLADGDPGKGQDDLVRYSSDDSRAPGQLSYTVLQQLDRPNRFATLEVWDTEAAAIELRKLAGYLRDPRATERTFNCQT